MSDSPQIKGKLLAIDHGMVRIGIAVSDATQTVARELAIITRKSKAEDFAKIVHIAREQQAVALIVGIPQDVVRAEQGLYSQADKVLKWVEHLRTAIDLPVILWDETLTTVEARELALRLKRKPQAHIDDLAARVMLQSYLDAKREQV
jgi:putative Holliday junction resolvase